MSKQNSAIKIAIVPNCAARTDTFFVPVEINIISHTASKM